MSFSNFKSAAPTSNALPAGSHVVTIVRAAIVNSFMAFDKVLKKMVQDDDKYPWDVPTGQILLELEDDKKRKASVRLNDRGYMKSGDITPEEIKDRGLIDMEGFIGEQLESGKVKRLENPANTEVCHNILNKLFAVVKMPLGSSLEDFMEKVVAEQISLGVKVVVEEYNGKKRRDVVAFFNPADMPAEKPASLEL